jgi:16S rRNA (guanine966-N2)-methyltransferase
MRRIWTIIGRGSPEAAVTEETQSLSEWTGRNLQNEGKILRSLVVVQKDKLAGVRVPYQWKECPMRVIAGEAKGRTLKAVPGQGTRPIADRVKESLFNILRWRVPGCHFLDLFAGTGSVGIEALSQGAERAVFVEKAPKAVRTVHENLRTTGLSRRARVIQEDVFRFLFMANQEVAPEDRFDVIYVAPPQYQDLWAKTLLALEEHPVLAPDGIIVAQIFPKEYRALPLAKYVLTDQRTYGSTMLCFYEPPTDGAER